MSGSIAEAIKSDSTTLGTSLLGRSRRFVLSVGSSSPLILGSINAELHGDFVAGTVSEAAIAGVDRGDGPDSLS